MVPRRFALAAIALLAAASGQAVAQTRWNLAAAYGAGNFHTENLVQFAADVARATGGRLEIAVHPSGSLFKAPEIKRAVQSGQAQIGEVLLVNFENAHPLYGLDGIPFLATGYQQARRLYQASRPALAGMLAGQGLRLLYTVPWPPQGLFVRRPIDDLGDMRGARWRAYSPATARLAELIGARVVTVQAAELAQALATGVVDSYMSSCATGYDSKTYEYLKVFYDVEAWVPKNAVIVSQRAFAALDPADQQALQGAAAAAEARGWQRSVEKNDWYKQQLAARGVQILTPPARLQADFQRLGQVMLDEWLAKAGPVGRAIVAALRDEH
jgi:TRAP-type C4-dicarboxylate transport system substrate-binding protein